MQPQKHSVIVILSCLFIALLMPAFAADDVVTPATCTMTNFRASTSIEYVNSVTYTQDDSILFTNCVMVNGADTNAAVQGLSNVTISVTFGTSDTNLTASGTAQVASNGTWYATTTVPTGISDAFIEVTITDSLTNSYTYGQQKVRTAAGL